MRKQANNSDYRMLSALERGPASVRELAQRLHLSEARAGDVARRLFAQTLIHIHTWRRSARGPFARIFALGRGTGVEPPKPPPYTHPERCQRWRASGGDHHRSTRLKRDGRKISSAMTMAGMLGVKT